MGQRALAVVYGVPVNDELYESLRSDPNDPCSDIMDECQKFEMGSDMDCLGVSVGTTIYAEDGERELPTSIGLSDLTTYLEHQIKDAKVRWQTLAATVLEKKQVTLPTPELMLVMVERA